MVTTIKVGMLGLGTVGSGVVERLREAATKIEQMQGVRFQLAAVAVNHLNAPRKVVLPVGTRLTDSIDAVVTDAEIQLVVEVMGTVATAKAAIINALQHGKSVVTANKDLIATAGDQLVALAQQRRCDLFYEASVAGGIPILRTLTDSYATDTVQSVTGIINGTANYILSAMTQTGQSYAEALAAAQRLGYAEADPSHDVQGIDAAYKLIILSRFAFGQGLTVEQVRPVGITDVTAEQCRQAAVNGWQIKLLAQAQQHGQRLYCRVAPAAVSQDQALSQVGGVQNGIMITSQAIGDSLYTGPGAGSSATANSVLNDMVVAGQRIRIGIRGAAFNRNHHQLTVTHFNRLAQSYLIFSDLPAPILTRYANEERFTLEVLGNQSYQTGTLWPEQLANLKAEAHVKAIPIAGSAVWSKRVAALPVQAGIAI